MLNMSSGRIPAAEGDLTAKAVIRNTALRLFAERGPDGVSVREIAAAAGVSPALVIHHYGSKAGLRAAVDDHVAHTLDAMLDAVTEAGLRDALAAGNAPTLAEAFVAGFPAGSPVPGYLRRLLLTDDPAGDQVLTRWHAESERVLAGLEAAGVARPSRDRRIRAAFLMANDLAALLLARQIRRLCDIDVQTPVGMTQWAAEAMDVYTQGVFTMAEEAAE